MPDQDLPENQGQSDNSGKSNNWSEGGNIRGDENCPVCFMAGTLIRTPHGEVPVEALKRGDLVVTADGRTVPVIWLGKQTISTRFADPVRVLPIRVRAGALDENVPSRDLLLPPTTPF